MALRNYLLRGLRWMPVAALGLSVGLAMAQANEDETLYYGGSMLSQQEQTRFQERLRAAESLEERQRIQAEHRNLIRQRAQEQGFNPDGIYGYQMMTPEQRQQYHQRMQELRTTEERLRFREEHRQQMQQQILERNRGDQLRGGQMRNRPTPGGKGKSPGSGGASGQGGGRG